MGLVNEGRIENDQWLDRVIATLKATAACLPDDSSGETWTRSDARCYELIEEMGREGLSCLIYTGEGRKHTGTVTYCQLRRNGVEGGANLGAQAQGTGAAATRIAICRAYIAFKLRSSRWETGPEEIQVPRET